jgi:flagellar biosynthesis chaperone FliJ
MTLYGSQIAEHYQRQIQTLSPLIDGYRKLAHDTEQASLKVTELRNSWHVQDPAVHDPLGALL